MKSFRKVLFWIHLVAGATGAVVIFIMCVTGAVLSFEKNIIEFAERGQQRVASASGERLPVSRLIASAAEAKPNSKPSSITLSSDPASSATISLGRDGRLFIDPYTGVVLGEGNAELRGFFSTMTSLHRWLALEGDGRSWGKAITGFFNAMFLVLAITGLYIWMPRKLSLRNIKPVLWFRQTHTGKARDFNWHNVTGFWCSLVLIVLTATGMVISYRWASDLVYTLTGNDAPVQQARKDPPAAPPVESIPANIDALWTNANTRNDDWKSTSLRLPIAEEAVFTVDEGKYWNIFGRSTLTLNTATAEVAKWEPYSDRNSGQQLRLWMRFTHTGESFGFVGQLVGFIACLGGALLVYTGVALSIRRFARWLKRRRAARAPRRTLAENSI
ncbi:MAG TPA: PepSY-associated TM helix domain-containing protein [Pyrinomonadaceae bacterium]|nr:PepSY-associated TM helix domain-containing protein [Pyrinomonadaceae bacterium]